MKEIDIILDFIKSPQEKTILEVGSHDDTLTRVLAQHFRTVYSYYEFLKIPEYQKNNIVVKKVLMYQDICNIVG